MAALVNAMRARLTGNTSAARGQSSTTATSSASKGLGATVVPASIDELRSAISRQLRAIDLRTAGGRHQGRRMFIESVLVWDFGDRLLEDHRLDTVVRDVEQSLIEDAAIAAKFDSLIASLASR